MRLIIRLAALALIILAIDSERIADCMRWIDQRLELFSPRGAGLYARVAPRLLAPLYHAVAAEVVGTGARSVISLRGVGALQPCGRGR